MIELASGAALRESIEAGLPSGWELDEREQAILALAAQQVDEIAGLKATLEIEGMMTTGSKGQVRLHPAVAEIRLARLALVRMLGELQLPDADREPRSASSRRAVRAATARWDRKRLVAERRAGGEAHPAS